MTARPRLLPRLRVVAMTIVLTVTGVAVQAAPVAPSHDIPDHPFSLPLPFGLGPQTALAAYCASGPSFQGKLTQQLVNSGTPSTAAWITSNTVYGWISRVDAAWSCTLYRRYSGLTWNVTSTLGIFDYGTIINSTSVSCNWGVGSTDYLKANGTQVCPSTDTSNVLSIQLTKERVYQADASHNGEGDYSFVHSDCATTPYYGAEVQKGSEASPTSFSTGTTNNRPGANCDPIALDSTNTSQTVTYDATVPTIAISSPSTGTPAAPAVVPSAFATVEFDATDAVAGFGGTNGWSLQRKVATPSGGACGTFANDGAAVTGTSAGTGQHSGQSLTVGKCYQWVLTAADQNGNAATAVTSGTILTDTSAVLGSQPQLRTESWDLGAGDSLAVSVGSGNVLINHPIVSLPMRGSSLDIGLTYNSQDAGNVGFGAGWRLNVQRRLTLNADNTVTFIDGSGARYTFTNPQTNGTVTTYPRPSNLYATLVKDTSQQVEFTLTYSGQSLDMFDIAGSEGLLTREQDRFGNGVTLAYVSGTNRITTITDTAASPNRVVNFAYDGSNRLTSITDWAYVSGGVVQTGATGSRRVSRFFYDGSSNLAGWADPLNTTGSCPTGGSHLTCLTLTNGLVTRVGKTQTYETLASGVLGSATRAMNTDVVYSGSDVAAVKDAEQVAASGSGATFSHLNPGQTQVVRPGTPASTTRYTLASPTDAYGRITSVKRLLGASTWIEQRTAYNSTYPIEPASITDNYVDGTPSDTAPDEDRITAYTYVTSSLGLVSRLTEPLTASTHRTTDYTYNAHNDVTQQIVALDGSGSIRTITRFCYDASCTTSGNGLTLLRRIDNYVDGTAGNGAANVEDVTTSFTYDTACAGGATCGQVTRETRANYTTAGTLLDSRAIGHTYDDKGDVTSDIANYVNGTVTSPGDDITPNATTGARTDLTIAHIYDTAGNRVSTADPRRAIESAKGTALNADDFIGRSTFDPLGQTLTSTTATTPGILITQKTASSVYDELGRVRQATDFGGLVTGTEYDRTGRGTKTFEDTDGAGAMAAVQTGATTHDAAGRVLTMKDQRQVASGSLGYNQMTYDELGREIDVTEAAGSSPSVASTTHLAYDTLDRKTAEVTAYGTATAQTTSYTYDLGGRTTAVDDEFTCTTESFDYRDLVTQTVQGHTGGGCGTSGSEVTISHAYDGLGRATRDEIAGASRTRDDTYDAAGNRLTAATASWNGSAWVSANATTYTLNPLDQVMTEAITGGTTTKRTYDPAGNVADVCRWEAGATVGLCLSAGTTPWTNPPTHVASSAYDARNQRVSLTDGTTGATTTYDADHNYQVNAVYVPTGSGREHQTLYGYDGRHRVTSISQQLCVISSGHACSSTTATGSDIYAYDTTDNRTRVDESNGTASSDRYYCYDARGQLTRVDTAAGCSSGSLETGTYDTAGNRTDWTINGGLRVRSAYDGEGQLCDVESGASPGAPSCTGGNIAYDEAGRTAEIPNGEGFWRILAYDGEGRITEICDAACTGMSTHLNFTYDADGRRTSIDFSEGGTGESVTFRYDGDVVTAEYLDGVLNREYLTDESGAIVKMVIPTGQSNPGTYIVVWNGHGDATGLWRVKADGSLERANTFTYGTWGEPGISWGTNSDNASQPYGDLGFRFLYAGHYGVMWDDRNGPPLYLMGARHYDAEYGRFLQPDPSAAEANLYGYAGNGPVSRVDSSGGSWCALLLSATATGPVGIGAEALCWGITGLLALALIPPVSSLTTEIVRAAEKAARQNRPSPRKCAVIGENALRVEVKARIWHCETYSPQMNLWRGYRGPSISEKYVRQAQLRDNAKWISRMMAEGRIIFDIGPDLVARARGQRDFLSPYYFLEYRLTYSYPGRVPLWRGSLWRGLHRG